MALFSRLAVTLRAGNHAVTRDWKSAQRPAVALRFFSTPASAPLTESPELDEEKKFKSYYARIVRKFSMLGLYQHAVDLEDLEAVIQRSMEYFMYRLGMSKLEAVRVISLHPMIATYSKETMDSKVDWMRRNGLTMAMISKATRNHPSWIGRSEASMEKIKNWLLAHGLAPSKIPFVLMVFPNGVSLKLDSLDAKVEYLKSVGVDDDHLRRILNRFPQVLTMGLDRIQLKVESLRAWGVPEERIPKIAAVVPEFSV